MFHAPAHAPSCGTSMDCLAPFNTEWNASSFFRVCLQVGYEYEEQPDVLQAMERVGSLVSLVAPMFCRAWKTSVVLCA